MIESPAIRSTHTAWRVRALLRRPPIHALVLGVVLVPCAILASYHLAGSEGGSHPAAAAIVTGIICVLGGALVLRGLSRDSYPHTRLGLCNIATILRATGTAVLAGLITAPGALSAGNTLGWTVMAIAALVLALDGVDGWAARRSGLRSAFGARFDVEVDVLFAIVMSVLAWQAGKVGIWFLALGGLRPAFLLASVIWPALRAPLPDAFWRKSVAAAQMVLQVALLAPVIVPPASQFLGAFILGALVLSFAVDIRWLVRQGDTASHARQSAAR